MNENESKLSSKARSELRHVMNCSTDQDKADAAQAAMKAQESFYRCTAAASKNKRLRLFSQSLDVLQGSIYQDAYTAARDWYEFVDQKTTDNDATCLAQRVDSLLHRGVPAGIMRDAKDLHQSLEAFDSNKLPNQTAVQRALANYIRELHMALEFCGCLEMEQILDDLTTWELYQQSRLDIVLF